MGSSTSIGEWINDFKDTPVFFEYNRYYNTGDITIVNFLYTFLNFGKKLDYVDESFNEIAFRDWCDVENRLNDLVLDDGDVIPLKRILTTILPPFSFDGFYPKFGPGSVSEKGVRTRISKIRNLKYDPVIDRFIFRGHIGMYGLGDDHGLNSFLAIPSDENWTPARGVSSRVARLHFVPKNIKTSRSICMEPNTLMFFQQSVLARAIELLESSSLNQIIRLKDQSYNRYLSCLGSIAGDIDTIDLSSASDSLSFDLVKKIFPSSWQIVMRATRSSYVQTPDGSIRTVKKFAPMGSALCFPVQCLTFASVCIYATCLYTYDTQKPNIPFDVWLTPSTINRITESLSCSPLIGGLVFNH